MHEQQTTTSHCCYIVYWSCWSVIETISGTSSGCRALARTLPQPPSVYVLNVKVRSKSRRGYLQLTLSRNTALSKSSLHQGQEKNHRVACGF